MKLTLQVPKKGTSELEYLRAAFTLSLHFSVIQWPWPVVIVDAFPVGFKAGLHCKANHKRNLGDVQDTREEPREHLAPLIGGGQFLMINESFIEARFGRKRRNVEKEASMYSMLT